MVLAFGDLVVGWLYELDGICTDVAIAKAMKTTNQKLGKCLRGFPILRRHHSFPRTFLQRSAFEGQIPVVPAPMASTFLTYSTKIGIPRPAFKFRVTKRRTAEGCSKCANAF
jgi:hypothetical protein